MLTGQIYFKRATFLFSFPKKSNLQTDDKKITILPIKVFVCLVVIPDYKSILPVD